MPGRQRDPMGWFGRLGCPHRSSLLTPRSSRSPPGLLAHGAGVSDPVARSPSAADPLYTAAIALMLGGKSYSCLAYPMK